MRVPRPRDGVVLFTVLFCVLVLSILVVSYFNSTRQAGAVAFRFEKSEVIRQIAQGAVNEAFAVVYRETLDPGSSWGIWLIEEAQKCIANPSGTSEKGISTPLSLEKAGTIIAKRWSGMTPVIKTTAKIFDARGNEKLQVRKYYGKEGVGTLQLSVTAQIQQAGGKVFAETTLVRHHDFRIASVLSQSGNRTRYAPTFILDYLLLVREGAREFEETNGGALNYPDVKIAFRQPNGTDAAHRGKVFFGGTEDLSSGRMVAFDIPPSWQSIAGMLPEPPSNPVLSVDYDQVSALVPRFHSEVSSEISKESNSKKRKAAWDWVKSNVKGLFEASVKPLQETYSGTEGIDESVTLKVLSDQGEGPHLPKPVYCPTNIELVDPAKMTDSAYVDSFLEGAITRRCLYFSNFRIAIPSNEHGIPPYDKNRFLCLAPPLDGPGISAEQQTFSQMFQNLYGTRKELKSSFLSYFPLKAGGEAATTFPTKPSAPFAIPAFFNRAGGGTTRIKAGDNEFYPLGYPTLRAFVFESPAQLERAGIIEYPNGKGNPGRLKLRGIVALMPNDPSILLDLGKDGPLEIQGQGCIISLYGFRISNRLTKATDGKKHLCILRSLEGPIQITTSEPVHAFLMSLSKSAGRGLIGFPKMDTTLNLKGGLAVNTLNIAGWPKNRDHIVEYDPDFRSATDDLYQITLSKWITFTRYSESGS